MRILATVVDSVQLHHLIQITLKNLHKQKLDGSIFWNQFDRFI